MNFLAIETATDVCSVAVMADGSIVSSENLHKPRSHSERLVPMIAECLAEAALKPADLDVVALSAGPGSYTGLRIGASTAKGIVFATGAQLVGVSTLQAMAYPVLLDSGGPVIPILASRRGEYYLAAFTRHDSGEIITLETESIVSQDDIASHVNGLRIENGIIVLPDAADNSIQASHSRGVEDRYSSNWIEKIETETSFRVNGVRISAENTAFCASVRAENQLFDDASIFEPYYLRDFQARKPSRSIFDRLSF
jgi:tRNA threonylcarbamoyladenosine biosynthesis protein TsaB